MAEIEIGIGKSGRRAYGFDDIAIVPSRRTRDPEDVSIAWEIDAYRFELPLVASAMDGVMSPETAIALGRLGGLGVLNLEGLWTRYDDPRPLLAELADLPEERATERMREIYAKPIEGGLIKDRISQIRDAGVTVAASLTPQRTVQFAQTVIDSGVDIFVIQGTVVSAEHVSSRTEPLNLKRFIAELDVPVIVGGCATYQSALHLMRTGAAGILVGVGPGQANTTRAVLGIGVPLATSIADAAGARRDYLDESGGRYVHVIADGGMRTGGDIAKAIACGADAVMMGSPLARAHEAPGRGWHWGHASHHPVLPRGTRLKVDQVGTLEEVLLGPACTDDGSTNLFGGLRRAMAMTGYSSIKEFQKVEVKVAPALLSEGKALLRAQQLGIGAP
jgi:IMP dehydrogenase